MVSWSQRQELPFLPILFQSSTIPVSQGCGNFLSEGQIHIFPYAFLVWRYTHIHKYCLILSSFLFTNPIFRHPGVYTEWNKICMQALNSVLPWKKKRLRMLYNVIFSFKGACQRQIAQAIKWSNRGPLVVTVCVWSGLHPFRVRWHCAARHSLEYTLTCWHPPLSQLLVLLWDLW